MFVFVCWFLFCCRCLIIVLHDVTSLSLISSLPICKNKMSQLMRLWYLSHRWPAEAHAHPRCLARAFAFRKHEVWKWTKGPSKNQTSGPTWWLRRQFWRMSLRRTKGTIISWHGSVITFWKAECENNHRLCSQRHEYKVLVYANRALEPTLNA